MIKCRRVLCVPAMQSSLRELKQRLSWGDGEDPSGRSGVTGQGGNLAPGNYCQRHSLISPRVALPSDKTLLSLPLSPGDKTRANTAIYITCRSTYLPSTLEEGWHFEMLLISMRAITFPASRQQHALVCATRDIDSVNISVRHSDFCIFDFFLSRTSHSASLKWLFESCFAFKDTSGWQSQ